MKLVVFGDVSSWNLNRFQIFRRKLFFCLTRFASITIALDASETQEQCSNFEHGSESFRNTLSIKHFLETQ